MRKPYSAHEITCAIRPGEGVYVGKGHDGVWVMYAATGVCFIKEKIDACALMRWCSEGESHALDILELSGKIVCIPMSTPDGVCAISKRLVS